MAKIKTDAPEGINGPKEDLNGLKEKFDKHYQVIKEIKSKNDGKRGELSYEDKKNLRIHYSQLVKCADLICTITNDEKEKAEYKRLKDVAEARAKEYGSAINSEIPKTTFDDVKGLENVKKLVMSFGDMIENPDAVKHYHIEGGLGMLMYGAPGTGKTMFAKAIANRMKLPLFIITPDKLFKSHVGESEESVSLIFDEIDASVDGAVLFIDECESIFSKRSSSTQDYKSSVTTILLQRINGFNDSESTSKRVMIAATNRPWDIDEAYLRFKRFSHLVHVTPPDPVAKHAIIESKLKGIGLEGITIDEIVDMSERQTFVKDQLGSVTMKNRYYSSADICGVIEEACRLALVKYLQQTNRQEYCPVNREMVEKAFETIKPSISADELKLYEEFEKNR